VLEVEIELREMIDDVLGILVRLVGAEHVPLGDGGLDECWAAEASGVGHGVILPRGGRV
jgi:hypothetical protein